MKKLIIVLFLFSITLFGQNSASVMKDAFNRFSKTEFDSLFLYGGAFYFGDNIEEMPMLVTFYSKSSGNTQNIKAIDGLFGSIIFEAYVNNNILKLNIPQYETNFTAKYSTFALSEPIMRFPQIYSDIIQYKFIDLNKKIVSSNITLGKNWHTLQIGYRDRVDAITFSAKTFRVRTYTTKSEDNTITVNFSSYSTIANKPYPMSFILKSSVDNREIRFNVTNAKIGANAKKEANSIGW